MKDIKRKELWKLHNGNETCVMKTHYQCRFKNLPKIINLRQTIYQPRKEKRHIIEKVKHA